MQVVAFPCSAPCRNVKSLVATNPYLLETPELHDMGLQPEALTKSQSLWEAEEGEERAHFGYESGRLEMVVRGLQLWRHTELFYPGRLTYRTPPLFA